MIEFHLVCLINTFIECYNWYVITKFLGPNVNIYAATHSVEVDERRKALERAYPVEIGDDVWIGGNVTIICSPKGTTRIGNGELYSK